MFASVVMNRSVIFFLFENIHILIHATFPSFLSYVNIFVFHQFVQPIVYEVQYFTLKFSASKMAGNASSFHEYRGKLIS